MERRYGLLRERVKLMFGTLSNFAAAVNQSRATLCYKFSGRVKITTDDIELYCKKLKIPYDDIPKYFFYN